MTDKRLHDWIEARTDEMVDNLVRLVNIRSVSDAANGTHDAPYGEGCKKALNEVEGIAKSMGFDTFNHENYCASAIWKGRVDDEIGLFGHLDVVPEGRGWTYEPYNATVKDGIIIGRGAWDNKGPTVASLYAVKYLKDHGINLKHTIRMYFGANEEAGMADIKYYIKHNPMPKFALVPDVDFPACYGEKGIFRLNISCDVSGGLLIEFGSGQVPNMFPAYAYVVVAVAHDVVEKALLGEMTQDFEIEEVGNYTRISAKGKASHACMPQDSDSAMVKLADFLGKVDLLDGKSKAACKFLADSFRDYYGSGFNIDFRDDTGRLTICGGMIKIKDGILTERIDIRYPVTTESKEISDNIESHCAKHGFQIEILEIDPPVCMPKDSSIIKLLDDTCNEILGKKYEPYVMGFTYARRLKNAVAYGPGQKDWARRMPIGFGGAHQPNEYFPIQGMKDAVAVYATVLQKLDETL